MKPRMDGAPGFVVIMGGPPAPQKSNRRESIVNTASSTTAKSVLFGALNQALKEEGESQVKKVADLILTPLTYTSALQAMEGQPSNARAFFTSARKGPNKSPRFLRLCLECAIEDKGETYCRRSHHLPLVPSFHLPRTALP